MKFISHELKSIISQLKSLSNPKAVEGMVRFGINSRNTYGLSIPNLRKIAKKIGKDYQLTSKLWQTGIDEAKILAGMINDPLSVMKKQMDDWIKDFD